MSADLATSLRTSRPSDGPGRLELVFLGSPNVVLPDGRSVRFAVDKALMLLAYLAYEPDEPKRRSELAALLYPDRAEDQAGVNLRQTLLRLRRAIGDEATEPPYLLSTQLNLQFNAISACWFDVVEFEAIIAAVQHHRHRRLSVCRDCLSQLAHAVQLYRGDFLSGLDVPSGTPYGDWLQAVRDDVRRKATWALHVLTPYHVQHAHYDAA